MFKNLCGADKHIRDAIGDAGIYFAYSVYAIITAVALVLTILRMQIDQALPHIESFFVF